MFFVIGLGRTMFIVFLVSYLNKLDFPFTEIGVFPLTAIFIFGISVMGLNEK